MHFLLVHLIVMQHLPSAKDVVCENSILFLLISELSELAHEELHNDLDGLAGSIQIYRIRYTQLWSF